jgi:hypothetical protein
MHGKCPCSKYWLTLNNEFYKQNTKSLDDMIEMKYILIANDVGGEAKMEMVLLSLH